MLFPTEEEYVKRHPAGIRLLAIASPEMGKTITRSLTPIGIKPRCVSVAVEVTHLVSEGFIFEVVLIPAALPDGEWWAIWGELCLLNPRPEILVYTRSPTFQLWTGVLELGGYDLIVEPFSARQLQEAVLRAAQSFRDKLDANSG
jgi:DNA-binding NtrC family response regulator